MSSNLVNSEYIESEKGFPLRFEESKWGHLAIRSCLNEGVNGKSPENAMKVTREEPELFPSQEKWSLNDHGVNWMSSLIVEHYRGYNTSKLSSAITHPHKSGLKSCHKMNGIVPFCHDAELASSIFAGWAGLFSWCVKTSKGYCHGIIGSFELKGTLKSISPAMNRAPTDRSGCSEHHPAWPWISLSCNITRHLLLLSTIAPWKIAFIPIQVKLEKGLAYVFHIPL